MYDRVIYDMGSVMDVEHHYPGNYGAPGVPRKKKRKRTPEDIERQNRTNRYKKVQRLILANFDGGWHVTLNYRIDSRPADIETARKQRKSFLDKMRGIFKKYGLKFKYIAVIERGRKGQALHHHLIVEDIEAGGIGIIKLIKKCWTYGNASFTSMYEESEYLKLAEYILKADEKGEKGGTWSTYTRSRNLLQPRVTRKRLLRKRWTEEPKPKKGYYIIKDSVINGYNPVTGYPYQHYSMRKIKEGGDSG